jgi:hypothetical protein
LVLSDGSSLKTLGARRWLRRRLDSRWGFVLEAFSQSSKLGFKLVNKFITLLVETLRLGRWWRHGFLEDVILNHH